MFRLYFILAVFLLLVFPLSTSAKVNLALHKSYTLSPKPNYNLCSDSGDAIQLTDGKNCRMLAMEMADFVMSHMSKPELDNVPHKLYMVV